MKIEVVEHAGGVTICAVYPSTGEPNECKPGEGGRMKVKKNDVSVRFEVGVPAGVRFIGRTVNGGIEVSLPSSASANVKAGMVNGDIATDFPLTVKGKFGRRRIEGSIGGGGPVLEMETVNGSIKLSEVS